MAMLQYNCVVLFSLWFHVACGMVFIENKAVEISLGENKVNNSYFGYSLLLQKGAEPIVIVGSPKQDPRYGGAIYACKISANSKGDCSEYNMKTSNVDHFNGNLLGLALDGGSETGQPFIACAPKRIFEVGTRNITYYIKGFCFHHENSSRPNSVDEEFYPLEGDGVLAIGLYHNQYYYDNAFGQAGIDIEYTPETGRVLMGAPGVKNWNGAMVSQSLENFKDFTIIPAKRFPVAAENINYLGYAVATARIDGATYDVAGAPRAENLYGVVKMYENHGRYQLFRSFRGDEMGGYFGSSILCSDVTKDGKDDLFVGVPMGKGATFDEGYVYFYLNALTTKMELYGSRKPGARFGTSISALGDIDRDGYNDVAISAPFEDDESGAVYIYMGDQQGIKATYSQRLSPLKFDGNSFNVKGFGLGLSKGNDIDGNGHNDLAIGAYKSNQIFVFNSKSVIDFEISLKANVSSITGNKPLSVTYCIICQQRSPTKNLKSVDFRLDLHLDYRTVGVTDYEKNITAFPEKSICESVDVTIQQQVTDILPFRIILTSNVLGEVVAIGENQITNEIPYSHGCGADNICQTKLALDLWLKKQNPNIVLGSENELEVVISAKNTGEPGYQCYLEILIPEELSLRRRDCKTENNTTICMFSRKLESQDTLEVKTQIPVHLSSQNTRLFSMIFDANSLKLITKKIDIEVELKCSGENLTPNKQKLSIGVLIRNSPYIEGKPQPENIYYDDESVENDYDISHTFTVGNYGPSPVKLNVYLLLPMVQYDGEDVFEFLTAVEDRKGTQVQCYPSNETVKTYEKKYDVQSVLTEPLNNTIVVDCFEEGSGCLEILCQGGYLEKSSEVAKYTVKVKTKTELLAAHFQSQLQKKSNVAYVASAFLFNSTMRIEGHSATLIFSSHKKAVPLWVWVLAAVLGILLLVALIFLLKKCHFFDRTYKDRLNDERLMDQQTVAMHPSGTCETETED